MSRVVSRRLMSNSSLILFIDGNLKDSDYYTQRLLISSPDFEILHAVTGQMGLTLCQWHPIDCVVMELDLPDISGFQVLSKLISRPFYPSIPVIILTKLANQYLLEAAIK